MAGYQVQGQYPFNVGAETLESLSGNELIFVANGGALLAQAPASAVASAGGANVMAFGATGNGVTDDTAAIQKAFNAAGGGTLLFPGGFTFFVSSSIFISSGTTIMAYGATILPKSPFPTLTASTNPSLGSGLGPIVFINKGYQATTLTDQNIRWFGGTIGPASTPHVSCIPILLRMVENTHIQDVTSQNVNECCAHLACKDTLVFKCTAINHTNAGFDHWDGPLNATVRDCVVYGTGTSNYGTLMNLDSTIAGHSSGIGGNFTVDNLRAYGVVNGVFVSPLPAAVSGTLSNITVRNCYFKGSGAAGGAGIVFQQVTDALIDNNTIEDFVKPLQASVNVSLSFPSSFVSMTNNTILNCAASDYIHCYGIGCVVANNRTINSTASGVAIGVDDPTTIILSNTLTGYSGAYVANAHPGGGGTTPAIEIDADSTNNRWNSVNLFRAQAGLLIGTSASAAAMTTYEESTWTPALQFGGASTGITYTVQSGTYIRVGKMVYLSGNVQISSLGSASGNATIVGVPYSEGGAASGPDLNTSSYSNFQAGVTAPPVLRISAATIVISNAVAPGGTSLANTDFKSNSLIYFEGWYRVT